MHIQLIRPATLQLVINNRRILVDPIFSAVWEMEAVQNTVNQMCNLLVELPRGMKFLEKAYFHHFPRSSSLR
jgi:hypothetical protein